MNNLGDYLNKFTKIFSSAKFQKDAVISIVKSVSKVELTEKDFDIKNFSIRLTTSPGVKSVIYMHKQKILEALKAQMGNEAPVDIR